MEVVEVNATTRIVTALGKALSEQAIQEKSQTNEFTLPVENRECVHDRVTL
jgi:hypothetical protein